MNTGVRNFLYDHPEFYEQAVPEPDDETPEMCRRIFSRFLPTNLPRSILDIGCGTARDLDSLSKDCADCWGIDFLERMIDHAKSRRPHLNLQVGDMRDARLGRTFDVILSMGSALMYALNNEDIDRTFSTFAAHAHPGSLLILDINNAASYLGKENFKPKPAMAFVSADSRAESHSEYSFDRGRQLLIRRRIWKFSNKADTHDICEYRLFFPAELDHLLTLHGFKVAGMFDNMGLRETDLSGARLYTAAIFQGNEAHA